ncbi:hypothetical protein J6590_053111 [Homalodisca vitripennis]|nr:hypothetical protein J6590_053111 [Homalodisca vitripennis]
MFADIHVRQQPRAVMPRSTPNRVMGTAWCNRRRATGCLLRWLIETVYAKPPGPLPILTSRLPRPFKSGRISSRPESQAFLTSVKVHSRKKHSSRLKRASRQYPIFSLFLCVRRSR